MTILSIYPQIVIYSKMIRLQTERKTVEELRRQRTIQQELSPVVPVAATEDNTYDYVYEVPDGADGQPQAPRSPEQRQSAMR